MTQKQSLLLVALVALLLILGGCGDDAEIQQQRSAALIYSPEVTKETSTLASEFTQAGIANISLECFQRIYGRFMTQEDLTPLIVVRYKDRFGDHEFRVKVAGRCRASGVFAEMRMVKADVAKTFLLYDLEPSILLPYFKAALTHAKEQKSKL